MALVSIKDATVVRVNRTGFGVQVKEADRESGGKTYYGKRFTVWFTEPHGLAEGDIISVSGFLNADASSWEKDGETKHGVNLSLNQPRIEGGVPSAPAPRIAGSYEVDPGEPEPF